MVHLRAAHLFNTLYLIKVISILYRAPCIVYIRCNVTNFVRASTRVCGPSIVARSSAVRLERTGHSARVRRTFFKTVKCPACDKLQNLFQSVENEKSKALKDKGNEIFGHFSSYSTRILLVYYA